MSIIIRPRFYMAKTSGKFCSSECPFIEIDVPLIKSQKAFCKLAESFLKVENADGGSYIHRHRDCRYGEKLYKILENVLGDDGLEALAKGFREE